MPRSFLIKKHSKVTGVVNADDTPLSSERHHPQVYYDYERHHNHHSHHMPERESLVKSEIKLSSSCSPTSVIVSSRNGGLSSYPTRISPYHDNREMQADHLKTKKTFAELPVDNNYDDKAYDLSIKRSPSPSSISPSSRRDEEINSKRGVNLHQHHRVSVVTGPSPPPTPPLSSEKSMTPPPGVAMISPIKSQQHVGGNLLLKAELEAPPSWHRPHPFPPYLPFGFPLYSSFPGHRAVPGHPVSYPGSLSPNSEHHQPQHYTVPPKYFPATSTSHLMPLSPPRSLGSNSNNPTIVRPEAHHPNILPNNNHPISPRVPSPNGYYPNQGHYLPQRHLNVQYNEIVTPAFCSTTPPWSSSEEKTQTSPCPSSDSDSGRENSMVTSSLPDSKQRRKGTNFAPVNGNTESPRYQCSDCNKNYSTYSGLSKHRQFHCALTQTKKSFSCKYCEKVYVSLGALKMHIRTHTLPCKCKLCGKAFSRPWLLQGHIRTHTGEKPFACQHCSRAFADRSNLRAHLQTHSDVKKYSCKACSKTFSRMSLLLKHEDGGCVAVQR